MGRKACFSFIGVFTQMCIIETAFRARCSAPCDMLFLAEWKNCAQPREAGDRTPDSLYSGGKCRGVASLEGLAYFGELLAGVGVSTCWARFTPPPQRVIQAASVTRRMTAIPMMK